MNAWGSCRSPRHQNWTLTAPLRDAAYSIRSIPRAMDITGSPSITAALNAAATRCEAGGYE